MDSFETLWDYRSQVRALYQHVRDAHTLENTDPLEVHREFCQARDQLFQSHPQSALAADQKRHFQHLEYFPYNPSLRFLLPIDLNIKPEVLEFQISEGTVRAERFGKVQFAVSGVPCSLSLFWLLGYGGGVFLPFGDATNNHQTYGGGRYLLDTIKHADLGRIGDLVVIDFNYAYNPSCAYNPRWSCPLTPLENRLNIPVQAGEKVFLE
jgi:uncharacterized protein (DUF1684 family)